MQFRATLVARGFTQIYEVNNIGTDAPVRKIVSVSILLAIPGNRAIWGVHQMDVVTAFLLEDREAEIYMEQAEVFVKCSKSGRKLVWKLKKSLYDLAQSAPNLN